jgi:hypothetical protein
MKTSDTKQLLAIRCPTCGAKPGQRCIGMSNADPHPARVLAADLINRDCSYLKRDNGAWGIP